MPNKFYSEEDIDQAYFGDIEEEEKIKLIANISLKDVHNIYIKWLKVSDTKRIDLGLAVALTREIKGTKIWVWIIGPSGDWKSEQINALHDNETTYMLRSITGNTLVSGLKKAKDLAPELRDKLVLISEGAQLLTLNKDEKNIIFAQLRDLYDGFAGADKGSGTRAKYKDLNVTLLAGSTPYIDGQQLIHQQLGTRELFYRTTKNDIITDNEIMDKVAENVEYEKKMREELKITTLSFIKTHKFQRINPTPDMIKKIKNLVTYICLMRASAEIDYGTGELRAQVFPEKPTRVYKQFLILYSALKSLSSDYSDERIINLLERLSKSSSSQNRVKALNCLINTEGEQTTNKISTKLKISAKTIYTELNILWNLGIITRKEEIVNTGYGSKPVRLWEVNKTHNIIKSLMKSKITNYLK